MKKILMVCLLLAGEMTSFITFSHDHKSSNVIKSSNVNAFTIYLVRHAEKNLNHDDRKDPPLVKCGVERAQKLATFFETVNISNVYSTDYKRTQQTAKAVSTNKMLSITSYNPSKLSVFYKKLLMEKQSGLIVGHSNTTAILAGMFVNQTLDKIPEDIYNRVYQITIINDSAHLQVFQQPYQCHIY